jgi:clan AA aspartic protease
MFFNTLEDNMGKVTENVKITNYDDLAAFKKKNIPESEIKSVFLEDVIVDTGATLLSLSKEIIEKLKLDPIKKVKVNTADGITEKTIYGPVEIEIKGRTATQNVMELNHPHIKALIGQLPLEQMDFLIHPGMQRVIPNPAHDNQMILDQLIIDDY